MKPLEPCAITWEMLRDYADGRLDPVRYAAIKVHLESNCAACRERLDWLADAVAALTPSTFETPPAPILSAAHSIFRTMRHKPSLLAQLAQQIFDSRTLTPQRAGARGNNDGTFRLMYRAEEAEIELYGEVVETQTFYLIGQARSTADAITLMPVTATLTPAPPAADEPTTAHIEGKEFHFTDIVEGSYVLTLWLENAVLNVSAIRIGL